MSLPDPLPSLADEAALLRLYQAAPGETTVRQLVALHLPLVWSTARRLVHGDASLAEDVTQIVFADFARKAPALPPDTIAAGWLHRVISHGDTVCGARGAGACGAAGAGGWD